MDISGIYSLLARMDGARKCKGSMAVETKWLQEINKVVDRYNLKCSGEFYVMWKVYIKGDVQKKLSEEWTRGVKRKCVYKAVDKPISNCWDGYKRKNIGGQSMYVLQ